MWAWRWAALAAAAAAAFVWFGGPSPAQRGDYLSPALRERVQQLKRDAATPAPSAEAVLERVRTLWDWANAYSLTGGKVPVDYPLITFTMIRALRYDPEPRRTQAAARANDFVRRYVREFTLLDENPNALGKVAISKTGPFRAGEYVTFEQVWTVGELPMQPGGGVILTVGRGAAVQAQNPAADDYVTIRASRPGARFEAVRPWGDWTSFITRETLNFRLAGEALRKGDTVTIAYGDPAGGSKGVRLQDVSNDEVTFPVHLDLEGKGQPMTPHWPAMKVVGENAVAFVNAIGPSVVKVGEAFAVAVRSEDRHKNLASGGTPEYEVLENGRLLRTLAAGSPAINVLTGLKAERPGVYRYAVRSKDGRLSGLSNPVLAEPDPRTRIYWGETHGHSGFAEGQGSPDGYFQFGRDVARLDFLTLSEHDLWMDDREWKTLQETTVKYGDPGKFTTILGYEWTAANPYGGHHNVFFANPKNRRMPVQEAPDLDELYPKLRTVANAKDVLIIPHAHQSGDWNRNDAEMERLAEITSGHGTFEYFGNKYLQAGHEIGFIGASDNHAGHPGYSGRRNQQLGGLAAVFAPRNTAEAIFAALKDRATYATTGERIVLDVRLNGGLPGRRLPDARERRITAKVYGTAPVDTIDVIKNGKVIFSRRHLETQVRPKSSVQVKLESSTEVFTGHKNPRGVRQWRGWVEVRGARLAQFREPWFNNPNYRFWLDPQNPNRVNIQTSSRGKGQALVLELEGVDSATEIAVHTNPYREQIVQDGTSRELLDRDPMLLPAEDVRWKLGDLRSGIARHEMKAGQNIDAIQVQLIAPEAKLDQEFSYVDAADPQPGDYYYLRVVQVDGSMAWSSPFWVGGSPRRAK